MPKPTLAAIRPYRVATPPHRVKLNQNESARDLPVDVRRRILARMREAAWNRYPPFPADGLRKALARRLRVPRDSIFPGNGSNEVLLSTVLATLRPRSRVVVTVPGYVVFERFAILAEAKVKRVPLDAQLRYRPEALVREVGRRGTSLVLLASPNNPTGTVLEPDDVARIADATDALVVIDEAYREFSRHDYRSLLRGRKNLVLVRTFSKAFALASLRLGYVVGDPETIAALEAATLPFNLDLFSQIAGEEILKRPDLVRARVKETVAERERVRAALDARPELRVTPSEANFLLVRFPDAQRAHRALLRAGVLVRDVSAGPGLANCLRLTIGRPRENDALLRAVAAMRP